MNESDAGEPNAAAYAALKAHAESLEKQLQEAEHQSALTLRQAELKAEAIRAGIVDIDGLKMLDAAAFSIGDAGNLDDAANVIAKFRREKPWLFGATSSSSSATPPQAAPTRRKLATEMSVEEWRAARAELLRRR